MSLDINKIINEAITETLEEDELLEEGIAEKAKENRGKLAAAAGLGAGAAAGGAAVANKDQIADAASKAAEKVSDVAQKVKGTAAAAVAEPAQAVKNVSDAAAKKLASAKEALRQKIKSEALTDEEKAKLARGGKSLEDLVKTEGPEEAKKVLRKGVQSMKDTAEEIGGKVSSAAHKLMSKLAMGESAAAASAIAAGLGAKMLLEQLRKVAKNSEAK